MDTTTTPTLPLPGLYARVHLPAPPNFIRLATPGADQSEASVAIGQLCAADAQLLALASARNLLRHWRDRCTAGLGLGAREADHVPAPTLAHDAIVDAIARRLSEGSWAAESPEFQAARLAGVRLTIEAFLEEISRG